MPMTEQHGDALPHWLPYFTVPSCDEAVARVRELGGEALVGPLDIGTGSLISAVQDSQGAAFALFEVRQTINGATLTPRQRIFPIREHTQHTPVGVE